MQMRSLRSVSMLAALLLLSNCAQADEQLEPNYEISFECAEAINVALIELKSSLSIDAQNRLGVVNCSIDEGKIKVGFYPSNPEIRGGGITYVLDASSFEIIQKIGER